MRQPAAMEETSWQASPWTIFLALFTYLDLYISSLIINPLRDNETLLPLPPPDMNQNAGSAPTLPVVTLRPFDLSDLDAMMTWASDDKVSRFCSWDTYTSRDDLLRYLTDKVIPHPWFRAICLDGGPPVGAVSVQPASPASESCRGEIGYVLASAYWGKGIVAAAVRAVLSTVFWEVEGLERVEAFVDVENQASQRVLEKVGFKREGVLRKYMILKGRTRDMALFSFLSTDPLVG